MRHGKLGARYACVNTPRQFETRAIRLPDPASSKWNWLVYNFIALSGLRKHHSGQLRCDAASKVFIKCYRYSSGCYRLVNENRNGISAYSKNREIGTPIQKNRSKNYLIFAPKKLPKKTSISNYIIIDRNLGLGYCWQNA